MKNTRNPSIESVATPRAVAIGVGLAVVVNIFSLAAHYHIGYSHLTFAHIDLGLLIPFFLGVLGPNIILRAARPSWALRNRELLFVFVLGWVGFMVPTWGMSNYLVGAMTTAEYFASPENQWRELFFPYLPDWVTLTNEQNANRNYHMGIPQNVPIPWTAWVVPVFWWMSFFVGLLATGLCFVILMRRQWANHERLSYPLAQTPVVLTETNNEAEAIFPSIMRNRMFITGAVTTFSIMLWNTAAYWTQWSSFPVDANHFINLELGQAFPAQVIRMNVLTLAFSYFVNIDVLFSVWVFQIINTLEQGFIARFGIASDSGTAVPGGLVAVQFVGGMIAFAIWGFWIARRHLRTVWKHVLGNDTNLDDEDEFISYRAALVTGACGLMYIVLWLYAAGMSFPVIFVFLSFLFLFYFALCRVVAESGLVFLDLPINAHQFTVAMLGSASLSPQNLTVLGVTNAFSRNWKTFTMIIPSHVARLKSVLGIRGGVLLFWAAATFAISAITAIAFTAYSGYRLGGASNYYADVAAGDPGFYSLVVTWMQNSTQITGSEVLFLLTGMGIVIGMMVARHYISWWPVSPIGFVVAAGGPVRNAFFPVFLAWLIKTILIRTGGIRLYNEVQPLMIGIMVGYVIGASIAILADILYFPGNIHELQFF